MYDVWESFITDNFVFLSLSKLTTAGWLSLSPWIYASLCLSLHSSTASSSVVGLCLQHHPLLTNSHQLHVLACCSLYSRDHSTLNLSHENSQMVRLDMLMLWSPDSIWFHWFSVWLWLMYKSEVGLRSHSSKTAASIFGESMQIGHHWCHGSWALDLKVTLTFSQCVLQGPLHQHTLMWRGMWW